MATKVGRRLTSSSSPFLTTFP